MTRRRGVVAGGTYLVERECEAPCFHLVPFPDLRAVFFYCLARASCAYGVELNAYPVQPLRWTGVVTLVGDRLSPFLTWFHQYVSKCLRPLLGTELEIWSSGRTATRLLSSREEKIEAVAEVLAAPALAWIDDDNALWTLRSALEDYSSAPIRCTRPRIHFRSEGGAASGALLAFVPPPGFEGKPPADLVAAVLERNGGSPSPVHLVCGAGSNEPAHRATCDPFRRRREITDHPVSEVELQRLMELWCRAGSPPATDER